MTPETSGLRPTPEILALIAEIDAFTEVWRARGEIQPERLIVIFWHSVKDERYRGS